MKKAPIYLIAFVFIYLGCSSSFDKNYESLVNQGILPLSSQNAYVGSNLYLAQEFTRSSNLYNFLKGRGAPAAIELKDDDGPQIYLYYPSVKEFFIGDLVRDEIRYQWIVRGPFNIARNEYRDLIRLNLPFFDEPVFAYQNKPFRFKLSAAEIRALTPTVTPTYTPTPVVKHKKPVKVISKVEDAEHPADGPTPTPKPEAWKPLTFDQQAIMMSQGFAERSPTGDVIHTVNAEGETLEKIAEWYTGSAANGKELGTLNGVTEGSILKKGMRLTIPLSQVKQFKAMK